MSYVEYVRSIPALIEEGRRSLLSSHTSSIATVCAKLDQAIDVLGKRAADPYPCVKNSGGKSMRRS